MPRLLAPLALLLALPALPAQAQDPGADAAAADLLPYLEAPAVLAATAALLHAEAGAYPAEPFALLGAPAADQTGARRVRLASLALSADTDTLRATYILSPTPEVPHERTGAFSLFREGDGYTARVRLDLRADPDLRDAALPLTQQGTLVVLRALGRVCLDLDRVRALTAEGRLAEAAPFLDGDAPIEITFVPSGGGPPVATATLTPPGAGP